MKFIRLPCKKTDPPKMVLNRDLKCHIMYKYEYAQFKFM